MKRAALVLLLAAAAAYGQEDHSGAVSVGPAGQSLIATVRNPSAGALQREADPWYVRVGGVGAIYHSSATFETGGELIPGASAQVSNNESITFDVGYDLTRDISAQLMFGIPPKPTISGQGTVAQLGELGAVRYGPTIASGLYRVRRWRVFQPYAGPGVAYAIFLKDHDAAVSDLHVANNFGAVFQAGADYTVNGRWSFFGDFKEVWLGVNAHGLIGGDVPVTAHVPLNPSLVSAGITYHFVRKRRK
ncbi:MAG TPA: OmpW family outer membrane protein [Silvibacterium sp.]|nr:OmpW family outer membrane protein [Silvibacterium sp.]